VRVGRGEVDDDERYRSISFSLSPEEMKITADKNKSITEREGNFG
jgi:hypothetical protein